MLERNRFAIEERKAASRRSFDIRDADSGEIVGTAIEKSGFLTRTFRWVLPRRSRPMFLEVREKPDDSLVFTLQRGWPLIGSRVEVSDSHDQLVGTIHRSDVIDKDDNHIARLRGCQFLTEDDSVELGRVSIKINPPSCTLEVNPDLADLPLSKMLLLAATLAITLSE